MKIDDLNTMNNSSSTVITSIKNESTEGINLTVKSLIPYSGDDPVSYTATPGEEVSFPADPTSLWTIPIGLLPDAPGAKPDVAPLSIQVTYGEDYSKTIDLHLGEQGSEVTMIYATGYEPAPYVFEEGAVLNLALPNNGTGILVIGTLDTGGGD